MNISTGNGAGNSGVNAAEGEAVFQERVELVRQVFPDVLNSLARGVDFFEVVGGVNNASPHHFDRRGQFDGPELPNVWPMLPFRLLTGTSGPKTAAIALASAASPCVVPVAWAPT